MITSQRYYELVHEVFDPVLQEFDFEFHEENKYLILAKKGDIQLIFRLEFGYQVYLFSVEIKLLGQLGEQTTPQPYNRKLPVSEFTKFVDPDAKRAIYTVHTEPTLKRQMEALKVEMLKYCISILQGDTSLWTKVSNKLDEEYDGSWKRE